MADVFVSYKREDGERAKQIVDCLSAEGITVWWDRMIPAGANWDKTIEAEIFQARCVLVLWSTLSVASENVRCEADFARDAGVLIPARLNSCELPLFHRMTQYIDLQTWSGEVQHPSLQVLLERVRANLKKDSRQNGPMGFWHRAAKATNLAPVQCSGPTGRFTNSARSVW